MKTIKITILMMVMWPAVKSNAQTIISKSVNQKLGKAKVIKVKLSGKIFVNATTDSNVVCSYKVRSSGKVWGFSNISSRPEYKPEMRMSHDTMYISGEAVSIWQIGVGSYEEDITNALYLPEGARVIIEADDDLGISGSFLSLYAVCESTTTAVMQKKDLRRMKCVSTGDDNIVVNGEEKSSTYDYEGNGLAGVFISSEEAEITLK